MNSSGGERSHQQNPHPKLIATFSTYLVETNGYSPKVESVPELKTLLVWLMDDLTISEDGWARYFLFTLRQDELALHHEANREPQTIHCQLRARKAENLPLPIAQFLDAPQAHTQQFLFVYLQKIAWYAVRDRYRQVIERTSLGKQYREDDLRYWVLEKASDPRIFLSKFDLAQTTKIKTYANQKVIGIVRDRIKKDNFAARLRSMSDAGLLKGLTQRQFRTALQAVEPLIFPGLESTIATDQSHSQQKQTVIDCYLSLINLYNQVHQPQGTGRDRLPPITDGQLQTIANRYRQTIAGITGNDVKAILATSVRAARAYYGVNHRFQSLDETVNSDDPEKTSRTLEPPSPTEPFLQQLMAKEEQHTIATSVTQAFATLNHPEPITLYLEYGLQLKQETILHLLGAELGVKQQGGVSRRVTAFKRKLFKALTQSWQVLWQTHYGYQPDPERLAQLIDSLATDVDEYLKVHCQRAFYPPLNAVLQLLHLNKPRLNLSFNSEWMGFYQVCKTNLPKWLMLEVCWILFDAIKFSIFRTALKWWVQAEFTIDLEAASLVDPKVDEKLDRLIETWLHEGDEQW